MTIDELKKIGIPCMNVKTRKFYVHPIGETSIPDYYSFDDIFAKIYEEGIAEGIKKGKKEKINEIRKVLDFSEIS
jgi:hypothetical protein